MQQIQKLSEEISARYGLVVEETTLRPHGQSATLLVIVDDENPQTPAVDLDRLAALTEELSAALDQLGEPSGSYELEVSTRGVDRPLQLPRHFQRNIGRLLKMRIQESEPANYRLLGADGEGVTVALVIPGAKKGMPAKMGPEQQLSYAQISSATVEVEFS